MGTEMEIERLRVSRRRYVPDNRTSYRSGDVKIRDTAAYIFFPTSCG